MRMKRPADLLGTFVFDHEDFAVDIDVPEPDSAKTKISTAEESVLPAARKGLGPTGLEETAETEGPRERPPALRSLQQACVK